MGRYSIYLASLANGSAILAQLPAWHAPGKPGIFFTGPVALLPTPILFSRKDPARPARAVWLALVSLPLAGGCLILIRDRDIRTRSRKYWIMNRHVSKSPCRLIAAPAQPA